MMTIHQTLKKYFGYDLFRAGQEEIVSNILDGENVLAILPTGAGKSICYQVPALHSDRFSIVISPLIALMKDQVDALNKIERTSAFINSSLDYREGEKVLNDVANSKIKLLYVSPEKLDNQFFAERLKNLKPKFLFIDEAHCISEWGHNFRPSYRKIKDLIDFIDFENVAAFTATATPEVRKDIVGQLNLKEPKVFVKGFERDNLSLNVIKTTKKKDFLLKALTKKSVPSIIYCATRKQTESVSSFLQSRGINAQHYHAGVSNEVRRLIQDDFIEDRIDVIAATNAFGMGIDKKDIRTIIHYNIPASIENYYQEIGRAGRDGEPSNIYLLFSDKDKHVHQYLINSSYPSREQIETVYSLICDHGKIAAGSKSDKPIEIDKLLQQQLLINEINGSILNSALGILENSGYIKLNNNFAKGYSVKFSLTPQQLRKYTKSISDELSIDILLFLLREFGSSIFEKKTRINIDNLSQKLGEDKYECIDRLEFADGQGIIEFEKPSSFNSLEISSPRVKKDRLNLNVDTLIKRKDLALNRLDEMVNLVFSKECRFKVILKYFGEEVTAYTCGRCDICSSTQDTFSIEEFIEEKILDTLRESVEPLSILEIKNILLGSEATSEFMHLSTFGSATHFGTVDIEKSISSLIQFAQIEKLSNGKFDLRQLKLDLDSNSSKPSDNYEPYLKLYNSLRQIRKDVSEKFGQSVNLICPDEVLKEITDKRPLTTNGLMSIKGFTTRMFNKVGEDFLNVIRDINEAEDQNKTLNDKKMPDTTRQIFDLVKKRYSLKDIASFTKLPEAVVSMQIESFDLTLPDLIIDSLIDHKKASKILDTIQSGITNIKEIKSSLGSDISYGEIRVILAKEKVSSSSKPF
ncbi:MAG: RecQ family ATP-dependent DNA helicase [Melioribacteraceae bacterium]|nr:RecQ family ATP-dependent DNA helicase [Melioribacteraceae bacterium]